MTMLEICFLLVEMNVLLKERFSFCGKIHFEVSGRTPNLRVERRKLFQWSITTK